MAKVARPNPRLSINQLAAYLVASPGQRRRIIQDAKYPPTFQVNYYDFARNSINDFIYGGLANEGILTAEAARLDGETPTNDYEAARFRNNAEAIEAFLDCYDRIELTDMVVTPGGDDAPHLTINGVAISVRPEFHIRGQSRGQSCAGAIKFYFSKDDKLTDQSAPYITCVVMRHVQDHCTPANHAVRHGYCQVVDVFGKQVHSAPRANTRRFQDINVACQEITLWWPTVVI